MNKSFFSLVLAVSMLPATALAQNTNAPPALTDQQKQAMRATFERYGAQEQQLHQQMRYQILSALTPVHRRELASLIGSLAIDPNPDSTGRSNADRSSPLVLRTAANPQRTPVV